MFPFQQHHSPLALVVGDVALHNWSSLKKNIYVAVDSAALGNYFPAMYRGKQHNKNDQGIPMGMANDSVMQSISTD